MDGKKFRIVALRHYNTVISDFRKEIEGGHVHGSEDWVMYTTNFLCLFEVMPSAYLESNESLTWATDQSRVERSG